MKGLIVAAGQGVRLRAKGDLKPLIPIKGRPLIERVIDCASSSGIEEFFVVSGYRGDELRTALNSFAELRSIRITHVVNRNWNRANGHSVLIAKQFLGEPFVLMMCDHLLDPDIIRSLINAPRRPGTVTLAVDFNLDNPLNDPEDVTRVKSQDGRIQRIGKVLRDFDAIDTGVFLCTPIIFEALEASQAQGDDSISGAMNVLAAWKKAHIFDIGDRLWVDVDDPAAYEKAERLLESGRL
jgi:1L-myo-inositol 1-phosphate cytidylyltransferase